MTSKSDESGETIRVLLAGQRLPFMEALRLALKQEPDIDVVGAVEGNQAVTETERSAPDVVIFTDFDFLSGVPGAHAVSSIRERSPEAKVLILCDEELTSTLVTALKAGAAGYLTGRSAVEELIEATRAVHRGEAPVPPRMLRPLPDDLMGLPSHRNGTCRSGVDTWS